MDSEVTRIRFPDAESERDRLYALLEAIENAVQADKLDRLDGLGLRSKVLGLAGDRDGVIVPDGIVRELVDRCGYLKASPPTPIWPVEVPPLVMKKGCFE